MLDLVAYTDGGCRGNPGIGGWAFVLSDPRTGAVLERAGGAADTTNNRMEIQASVEALLALTRESTAVVVRTDSKYLIGCGSEWIAGWKARGWKRKGGPLQNIDLLQQLDALVLRHRVRWEWVRGHAGDPGNERADRLANEAMDRLARGDDPRRERRLRVKPTRP